MGYCIKILVILILLIIPSSYAFDINDITYNENKKPTFEYKNSPLIETMQGYYLSNNSTIGGKINLSKYPKLTLVSPINGRFWYADSNVSLNYEMMAGIVGIPIKVGPELSFNKSTGQIDAAEPENDEWTTSYGAEELSSQNSYLNKVSWLVSFTLHYEILNDDVNYITPFVFELGKWPKYIYGKNINDSLNISIYENNLIIHGTDKVLIFYKNSNLFYYKLFQNNGNYYVSIQESQVNKNKGELLITVRPIIIETDIRIIDILPPANLYSSLRLKPELTFKSSNNVIDNLDFTYKSESITITKNKKLQSDGTIRFDELLELEGDKIWYPFDSYYTEIIVEPPLLLKEDKNIDMPEGSDFNGKLQKEHNKITIYVERSFISIINYIFPLIGIIVLFILGLKFKQSHLWFVDLSIGGFFIWYISNNSEHIISIGSFISIFLLIISIIIIKKRSSSYIYKKLF